MSPWRSILNSALLRSTPGLADNAVEELLRYDTTAQFTGRTTTGPVVAGDTTIPAGANVAVMVGAANRDRRKWPDADQLRLDRSDPRSISFWHGIHHCLGAALARMELKLAIPTFLDAFGDYTVDLDTAEWKLSHTPRPHQTHRPPRLNAGTQVTGFRNFPCVVIRSFEAQEA